MTQRAFDYSKWDNIELSDDESDLHPNIDKDSWFRMKHRARLEREEKEDAEKLQLQKLLDEENARLNIIVARLANLEAGTAGEGAEFEDVDALKFEADELKKKIKVQTDRIAAIDLKRSWSVDEICKVKDEKTIVNKAVPASLKAEDYKGSGATERVASAANEPPTPPPATSSKPAATTATSTAAAPSTTATSAETSVVTKSAKPAAVVAGPAEAGLGSGVSSAERDRISVMSYNDFAIEHEDVLEHYSEIASLEDTKKYLFKKCDILLHEHAQNYLLLSCLEDEMNQKHKRCKLVCRQSQIISHICELATSMKRDPRDVVLPFFKRLEEKEHLDNMNSAVKDFIQRIQKRAVEKRKEMDAEEARERRAGNVHGLDPMEVFHSLPLPMREAFESQDIAQLQSVLGSMEPKEAKKWMKLCADSGLWVPADSSVLEDDPTEQEEYPDPA
jgi:cell division cycle protein 37